MSLYLNLDSRHCLNDFSKLVLSAHSENSKKHLYLHAATPFLYELGPKEKIYTISSSLTSSPLGFNSFSYTKSALTLDNILGQFEKILNKKESILFKNDKPLAALDLLERKIVARYYSGELGAIRSFFHIRFGWKTKKFKNLLSRIDKLKSQIKTLPQKEKSKLKEKIKNLPMSSNTYGRARKVFSETIHGRLSLSDYEVSGRYTLKWMSPSDYLRQVDPHFQCHTDEESMPWLTEEMIKLIQGEPGEKFAPLKLDPHHKNDLGGGYFILEHEGRHRALAAKRLGIHEIPVAIRNASLY